MGKCEVCQSAEATEIVNIGLDVGFHIGDYGKELWREVEIKPACLYVSSFHLCRRCEKIAKSKENANINIITKLKETLKPIWLRKKILENLKYEDKG
jgi:hypothetical protein